MKKKCFLCFKCVGKSVVWAVVRRVGGARRVEAVVVGMVVAPRWCCLTTQYLLPLPKCPPDLLGSH